MGRSGALPSLHSVRQTVREQKGPSLARENTTRRETEEEAGVFLQVLRQALQELQGLLQPSGQDPRRPKGEQVQAVFEACQRPEEEGSAAAFQ